MIIEQEPYYRETNKELEVYKHVSEQRLPLLLKGPTGTGKSRFVEYMAYQLKRDLITITCHEETSATDLIGRYIIKGAETVWLDGPMAKAVREGSVLYLDEIAEARPDIIVALHSLSDYRRILYIDKLGAEISAHPDFLLVASFNPGYQKGFKELKPSTRQRFVALSFHYPEQALEEEIVATETNLEKATVHNLVRIANKIRNLTELGLTETISTRLVVNAAMLIHSGLPKRRAVRTAMLEPLSDDLEVLQALEDVANLFI